MEARKTYVLNLPELQKTLGIKGFPSRLAARCLYGILNLKEYNRIQKKYADLSGAPFAARVLEEIGVTYHIPDEQLKRLPAEGGFILVCNHPYGSLDGLILETVVGALRPDLKTMTTFMLTLIPGLKDGFIPVDNFSSGAARSLSGLRAAMEHLAGGHPLALFPAGEVSTWQRGQDRTARSKRVAEDKPWADSVIKLVKKAGLPVIPMYFEGSNSLLFHRLGRIHPRLRTLRLPREMFNKAGRCVQVRIGQPLSRDEISSLDIPALGRCLKSRCYALETQCRPDAATAPAEPFSIPVADPVPPELVRQEMAALSPDHILFEDGDYRVCLIRKDDAPQLLRELFRLREEVFRSVGEGTGRPIDTDPFDDLYYHLILWHIPNGEIAGAYRLGDAAAMMEAGGGLRGLYTASLYDYSKEAKPLLGKCMELGRAFVALKYQREVHPLRLLLAGASASTLRIPHAEYCLGPVSISNDYPHFLKSLSVHFLQREFPFEGAGSLVRAPHPFVPEFGSVDPDALLQTVPKGDMDKFDRLLSSLSDGKCRLPVLVRKYFSCGAKLLCFNVDPDFRDSLDGLILLKLSDFPPQTLKSLFRGVPAGIRDAVFQHFYGTTQV